MKKSSFLFLLVGALLAAAVGQELTNLFFLHHSCGSNLISQGYLRDTLSEYNSSHGTRYGFWDHGYNSEGLRDTLGHSTGRTYSIPGDNTDPDGLHTLFTTENGARDSIMANHEVIAFKSCYPACNIPDTNGLHRYKEYYVGMRDSFFDLHPEKKFVVMSPPPLHRLATDTIKADNARAFADWLKSSEYLVGHNNLYCFDLFNHMAHPDDGSEVRNMLKYEYEIDHGSSNSHPNVLANRTVAPRFVSFMCDSIGQNVGAEEKPQASPVPETTVRPTMGHRFILPPGAVVHDMCGEVVWQSPKQAGISVWAGTNRSGLKVAPGVYVIRAGGKTGRIVVVK